MFRFIVIMAFLFVSCSQQSTPTSTAGHDQTQTTSPPTDQTPYAPVESCCKSLYYRYPVPPSSKFTAVVGWLVAIDIAGKGVPDEVDVNMVRLHATVNGRDTVLFEDHYSQDKQAYSYYGLYDRNPWFGTDDHTPMPYSFGSYGAGMVITPSSHPDRVYHFWDSDRSLVPSGATKLWFEAAVRITGGAGVQIGIDYWTNLNDGWNGLDVNNTEAGISDWYGNDLDWQVITLGK